MRSLGPPYNINNRWTKPLPQFVTRAKVMTKIAKKIEYYSQNTKSNANLGHIMLKSLAKLDQKRLIIKIKNRSPRNKCHKELRTKIFLQKNALTR